MSANKQKSWTKSVFTQLTHTQSVIEIKDDDEEDGKNKTNRAFKRSASFTSGISNDVANKKLKVHKELSSNNNKVRGEDWMEIFAPRVPEDLAVHIKKLSDLENWLRHCDAVQKKHPVQICLLSGPTGSGKTASVRVLAEANNYDIQEWINPLDQESSLDIQDFAFHLDERRPATGTSQLETFRSFLLRASRYKSLIEKQGNRLLLVEDFPNFLIRNPNLFEGILSDYMNFGKAPLIFIVADSKARGLNISYNLFPEPIIAKFNITQIAFNPIASTFMQKAMKRFSTIVRELQQKDNTGYQVPPQGILDSIVLSAQGDIRNALINFNFAALKGAPQLSMQPVADLAKNEQKTKARNKKQNTLKSVGRDETVTMMHSLGRVFNPKLTTERRFQHSPEEIADNFCSEPKRFLDFMQANYLAHFSDIEAAVLAANNLSLAETLLADYRFEDLSAVGLNIGIRSLMVANRKPVSAWLPVRGPKQLQNLQNAAVQERLATQHLFELNGEGSISTSLFATDYASYARCIAKVITAKDAASSRHLPATLVNNDKVDCSLSDDDPDDYRIEDC